jgi:hypothetical protein
LGTSSIHNQRGCEEDGKDNGQSNRHGDSVHGSRLVPECEQMFVLKFPKTISQNLHRAG